MKIEETVFKTCKEQGEWAELCFMTRAAGMGLRISKPFGESSSYDVGVECGSRILRVQVKSTNYRRPRTGLYSLALCHAGNQPYAEGTIDFFAAYLIPIDAWYVLPFEQARGKTTMHFNPGGKREKNAKYREAWDLLKGQNPRP